MLQKDNKNEKKITVRLSWQLTGCRPAPGEFRNGKQVVRPNPRLDALAILQTYGS